MIRPLASLFDLSGRVALITGGSRGLGLQIAEALGEAGATLVLVARRQTELAEAVARLRALKIGARALALGLDSESSIQQLMDSVASHEQRLDILVNNAGATWGAPAETYPPEAWRKVMDLNVTAAFLLCQAAAARFFLPQGQGVVLNIASVEGLQGHAPDRVGTIAYNTSKGALINMTRALAAEWGPRNIRVNALAPGFFQTRMTAVTLSESGSQVLAGTPLGKLGSEEDLKGAAVLLSSDASGHITGQVLVIDGGASII